jgi:hypothetical protein
VAAWRWGLGGGRRRAHRRRGGGRLRPNGGRAPPPPAGGGARRARVAARVGTVWATQSTVIGIRYKGTFFVYIHPNSPGAVARVRGGTPALSPRGSAPPRGSLLVVLW